MRRIKCIISYDGTFFSGYQVQPNKRTVQLELENALSQMHKGDTIKVFASGRTDASVHAHGQVIHFDSPLSLPEQRWKQALNALLPDDISVLSSEYVGSDFHARFDVVAKEYRYKVRTSKDRDVFTRHYAYHYPFEIKEEAMKEAAQYLIGTHDFTSFCASKTEVKDKIRTIYQIEIEKHSDEMIFSFVGNGFLYNMVRILVGTLLDIGNGKIDPSKVKEIVAQQNRSLAGKTVPGHGLYLWKVFYEGDQERSFPKKKSL